MTARISCRHGLDTIAGYRVVKTIEAGGILERPRFIGRYEGATSYGLAIEAAELVRRTRGDWAVVDTRYQCGCWSDARADVETSIGSR